MLFYQKLPTMSSYYNLGGNGTFQYFLQHCFICHPSDSTISEDAGIDRCDSGTGCAVRTESELFTFETST
jgi:hypothetical protein